MSWMREYPRPQLRRESFFCLNGEWKLNGQPINIPFPPQSSLSGFQGEVPEKLEYMREFMLPEGFAQQGMHIFLHFGAVDQVAELIVNDHFVLRHEGGYLPFSAEITGLLTDGKNMIRLIAIDGLNHDYPYGKQRKNRGGMWYTPVSGIWQTVWMEAVPEDYVEGIRIEPDLDGVMLTVKTSKAHCSVEVIGVGTFAATSGKPLRIDIPEPHLWTPEDPYLYPLRIHTSQESVSSYFALRSVTIGNVAGRERILLNGKAVFLNGLLDQGYFPDGIYLTEKPEAYRDEVRRMKAMGFNLLRKHCKVEPEAFYYACDAEGMLVMQDMVNSGGYNFLRDTALPTVGFQRKTDRIHLPRSRKRRAFFTKHALDTQAHLYNHPCVIAYTIFNEGWGQFDADKHYALLKAADSSRIYDATSGWFAQKKSDVDSKHIYFRNKKLKGGKRPLLLSECGGYARPIPGHMFNEKNKYGYGTTDSGEALTAKIEQMWREMVLPSVPNGLCGVIYTQVSDVEDEINGLYTYDRAVCKVNPERLRRLADEAVKLLEKCITK